MNFLQVDGVNYKLGYVEWVDIEKPRGEWEAFYNQLTLRTVGDYEYPAAVECKLQFRSR